MARAKTAGVEDDTPGVGSVAAAARGSAAEKPIFDRLATIRLPLIVLVICYHNESGGQFISKLQGSPVLQYIVSDQAHDVLRRGARKRGGGIVVGHGVLLADDSGDVLAPLEGEQFLATGCIEDSHDSTVAAASDSLAIRRQRQDWRETGVAPRRMIPWRFKSDRISSLYRSR